MNRKTLGGLRVLDFTWMVAGPSATRILADFGAEVIKVQSGKTSRGAENNLSGYFTVWNRNKKGIALNMDFPEARDIVLKLAGISDVVIENFSPRVMTNWGLGYEKLQQENPDLVMLSMSAMGRTGPWRNSVGFAPTIHALSGLTHLSSFDEKEPMGPGFAYADVVSGLYAALAVLAALEHRDRTGEGQYIDLSQYEAMCTLLGPTFMHASCTDKDVLPTGNKSEHNSACPHGCYRCSGDDAWCVIAVGEGPEWRALCRAIDNPALVDDERFSTFTARKEHEEELDRLIEGWTSTRSAEEAVRLLQSNGVPAGVVQNADDLAKDPQLKERRFFVQLEHPVLGKTVSDRSPIRFAGEKSLDWKAAPRLGEHNRYVYMDLLGMTEEEVSDSMRKGIIG